jgi:hypothetical protein
MACAVVLGQLSGLSAFVRAQETIEVAVQVDVTAAGMAVAHAAALAPAADSAADSAAPGLAPGTLRGRCHLSLKQLGAEALVPQVSCFLRGCFLRLLPAVASCGCFLRLLLAVASCG